MSLPKTFFRMMRAAAVLLPLGLAVPGCKKSADVAVPEANTISSDTLFEICIASTGADYFSAKAKLLSQPDEAASFAQSVVQDNKSPWQKKIIAQAVLEEIKDPKAYAQSRHQIVETALAWRMLQAEEMKENFVPGPSDTFGIYLDPRTAPETTDAGKLYRRLETCPGLVGEVLLKSTWETLLPIAADATVSIRQRQMKEWQTKWDADQAGPKTMRNSPPETFTAEQISMMLKQDESATIPHLIKSVAALAAIYAGTPNTEALIRSLGQIEYHDMILRYEESVQNSHATPHPLPAEPPEELEEKMRLRRISETAPTK